MSAAKYCDDPDNCTYSDCPTAFCDRNAEHSFAAPPGYAALIKWLKAEILDDEGAMINARDHAEWERLRYLEGHKAGLLAVKHHLRAARHND